MNKIEVSLSEKKINFILLSNLYLSKRVTVMERSSFKKALNEDEENELKGLAPASFFFF